MNARFEPVGDRGVGMRGGTIQLDSYDAASRTVDVVFATSAPVIMPPWRHPEGKFEPWIEMLLKRTRHHQIIKGARNTVMRRILWCWPTG